MGVWTAAAKDVAIDALTAVSGWAGVLKADAAITGITGTASTDNLGKTAHGLANGDLVVFDVLTGGAGLVVGRPYFVVGAAANTFQVALKPGAAAVDITTDYSTATLRRLVEPSGGSPAYARKAIAFAASSNGVADDSTNGVVVDMPPGSGVDFTALWSASSGGTLRIIDDVTPETYAGQGTYTITDYKVDANAGV